MFGAGSEGHRREPQSVADMVRNHKTNPRATGKEAENQGEILKARRVAAGKEIRAQQRRV